MSDAMIKRENVAISKALSISEMKEQIELVREVMTSVMKKDIHYGKIPGCGDKPSLLKPGSEILCVLFRLAPEFEVERFELENEHMRYNIKCKLKHIPTGEYWGEGVGSCSSKENKYRYKGGGEKIYTGQPVPKEYWNNSKSDYKKALEAIGGKGHTIGKNPSTGQWEICEQGEKKETDNPQDQENTILKMGKKRALVDVTLTATAASDVFTQDLEDMKRKQAEPEIVDDEFGDKSRSDKLTDKLKKAKKPKPQVVNSEDSGNTTINGYDKLLMDKFDKDKVYALYKKAGEKDIDDAERKLIFKEILAYDEFPPDEFINALIDSYSKD